MADLDVSLTLPGENILKDLLTHVAALEAQLSTMERQISTGGGLAGSPTAGGGGGSLGVAAPPTGSSESGGSSKGGVMQGPLTELQTAKQWSSQQGAESEAKKMIDAYNARDHGRVRTAWDQSLGGMWNNLRHGDEDLSERIFETSGALYAAGRTVQGATQIAAPIFPTTATTAGQGWGMRGGGSIAGMFSNPFSPGFNPLQPLGVEASPAAGEYYGNFFSSLGGIIDPNSTFMGRMQDNTFFEEMGYHGDQQNTFVDAMDRIKDLTGGENFNQEAVAALMDESLRNGEGNLDSFVETMGRLETTADAANISVDETVSQLGALSEQLQTMGLTKQQGIETGMTFQRYTGLPAGTMGMLLENQYIQGNIMAQGVMPQAAGAFASHPGAMADVTLDTVNQLRGMYKGAFSAQKLPGGDTLTAKEQEDAAIAHQLQITPEQLSVLEKEQKRIRVGAMGEDKLQQYDRARKFILDNYSGSSQDAELAKFAAGSGKYGSGKITSWDEVVKTMSRKGSPVTESEMDEISNLAPKYRADALSKIIERESKEAADKRLDKDKQLFDLTPNARKLLRPVTSEIRNNKRKSAMAGVTRGVEPYANSVDVAAGVEGAWADTLPQPSDAPLMGP